MAKLDSTGTAVVEPKNRWLRINANTQRGATMLLINRNAGRATLGQLGTGDTFFTHWYPVPTFDDGEEQEAP